MSQLEVSRSVHFVSLDAHPGHNSLVVTYEIQVSVRGNKSAEAFDQQVELARRSKQAQMSIRIDSLAQLTQTTNEANLAAAVKRLAARILTECPILARCPKQSSLADEIQLNLLYLVGRGQQSSQQNNNRPASSLRQRSAATGSSRLAAKVKRWRSVANQSTQPANFLYEFYCCQELEQFSAIDEQLQFFRSQFDEHLGSDRHHRQQVAPIARNLDEQLENLYGDSQEKLRATQEIRTNLANNQEANFLASPNNCRLLVCALVRLLRDSSETSACSKLIECTWNCLIHLMRNKNFKKAANNSTSGQSDAHLLADLMVDSVSEHADWLTSECLADRLTASQSNSKLSSEFYRTNAMLVILIELLGESSPDCSVASKLLSTRLIAGLSQLLAILARQLSSIGDFKLLLANEQLNQFFTTTFSNLIHVLRLMSLNKQFGLKLKQTIQQTVASSKRGAHKMEPPAVEADSANEQKRQRWRQFPVALLTTLNVLQMNRSHELFFLVEMETLKLLNNLLIVDGQLKSIMTRQRNLLIKCVIRPIILLLPFKSQYSRSSLLIVPFKCLNEITRKPKVRAEIFKSQIVLKCLLDYLVSLPSTAPWLEHHHGARQPFDEQMITLDESMCRSVATFYNLSVWLNLTTSSNAPMFRAKNVELHRVLVEFLVRFFSQDVQNLVQSPVEAAHQGPANEANFLVLYMEAKLVRNATQFIEFEKHVDLQQLILQAATCASQLIGRKDELRPQMDLLAVEVIAALANLLAKRPADGATEQRESNELRLATQRIFASLYQLHLYRSLESDRDDLLMVAINLLGATARSLHFDLMCQLISGCGFENIVTVLKYALTAKKTDLEMVVCALYTLSQLVNHSTFLENALNLLDSSSGQFTSILSQLIDELCQLLLHQDENVNRLASRILHTIKCAEAEQLRPRESFVSKRRFDAYNSKWLAAIHRSRSDGNELALDQELAMLHQKVGQGNESSEEQQSLGQLRMIGDAETILNSTSSGTTASRSPANNATTIKQVDEESTFDCDDDDDDAYDNYVDSDEDDEEASSACCPEDTNERATTFVSGPDANVIDAESMVRHLNIQ